MKLLNFYLLIIMGVVPNIVEGQIFSILFNDTINLSSLAGNPIEMNSKYYVANNGIGLSIEQGSYSQILKLNSQGGIEKRLFSYTPGRRRGGLAPLAKLNNNTIIHAVGERGNPLSNSEQGFSVLAFNEQLDTLWRVRAPDSSQFDSPTAIVCANSKVYAAGLRNYIGIPDEFYVYDGLLLILNEDGSFVDYKTIHRDDGDIVIYSIIEGINGTLYLGGNIFKDGGVNEGYLAKLDEWGNLLWDSTYAGFYETCSISRFDENHLVLSGIQWDGTNPELSKLNMINNDGEVIWTRTYGFIGLQNPYNNYVTHNKGIVLVGLTTVNSQTEGNAGYIMKADSIGNLLWQRRYNYNRFTDFFQSGIETSDYHLLISGSASDTGLTGGGQNLWVVKLDSMGCLEPNCWVGLETIAPNNLGIKVFPNPANEWLQFGMDQASGPIALELYSISGAFVLKSTLIAPLEAIQVNHLKPGIYIAKFQNKAGAVESQKIVISR